MRFDSQDFAQDVWLSFFRAALDRADLQDERSLVAYLAQMARLKVAEEYRHQTTQKIGLGRDVPFSRTGDPTGRGPTPSADALADDEWDRLTAGLSDRERQMLKMLRDGHTHADTAAAFQLSEKTVQRLVRRILSQGGSPGARRMTRRPTDRRIRHNQTDRGRSGQAACGPAGADAAAALKRTRTSRGPCGRSRPRLRGILRRERRARFSIRLRSVLASPSGRRSGDSSRSTVPRRPPRRPGSAPACWPAAGKSSATFSCPRVGPRSFPASI